MLVDSSGSSEALPRLALGTPPSIVSVDGPPTPVVMNRLLYAGRAIVWLTDARAFRASVMSTWKSMFGNQLLYFASSASDVRSVPKIALKSLSDVQTK